MGGYLLPHRQFTGSYTTDENSFPSLSHHWLQSPLYEPFPHPWWKVDGPQLKWVSTTGLRSCVQRPCRLYKTAPRSTPAHPPALTFFLSLLPWCPMSLGGGIWMSHWEGWALNSIFNALTSFESLRSPPPTTVRAAPVYGCKPKYLEGILTAHSVGSREMREYVLLMWARPCQRLGSMGKWLLLSLQPDETQRDSKTFFLCSLQRLLLSRVAKPAFLSQLYTVNPNSLFICNNPSFWLSCMQ